MKNAFKVFFFIIDIYFNLLFILCQNIYKQCSRMNIIICARKKLSTLYSLNADFILTDFELGLKNGIHIFLI